MFPEGLLLGWVETEEPWEFERKLDLVEGRRDGGLGMGRTEKEHGDASCWEILEEYNMNESLGEVGFGNVR